MALSSNMWMLAVFLILENLPVKMGEYSHSSFPGYCPSLCTCKRTEYGHQVDCAGQNLTKIPVTLSNGTTHLDLSLNMIAKLEDYAFSRFENLIELRLAHNQLTSLPPSVFKGIRRLQTLYLRSNRFKKVPKDAFKSLIHLTELHLDNNQLETLPADSFSRMKSLNKLWINANHLKECPVASLRPLRNLLLLNLNSNRIKNIPDYAFRNLKELKYLILINNTIEEVSEHAFDGLNNTELLDLNLNLLRRVPYALRSMPQLKEVNLATNKIEFIQDHAFGGNKLLMRAVVEENPIATVGVNAFAGLRHLESVIIHEAQDLTVFPDLSGCHKLLKIILDRANIKSIPDNLCDNLANLQVLDVHTNQVSKIPDLTGCRSLKQLNLGNNHITSLDGQPFNGWHHIQDLILTHNDITTLPAEAFIGLSGLQYLDLSNNQINHIDPKAFAPCTSLEDLNLGENQFPMLPPEGLSKLRILKTYNNKELKEIPPPEAFTKIQYLSLSYAYHCCEFLEENTENENENTDLIEQVIWLNKANIDTSMFHNGTTVLWDRIANISTINYNDFQQTAWDGFGSGKLEFPGLEKLPESASSYLQDYQRTYSDMQDIIVSKPAVQCKPMPGPFMPCDDLMGWWALRCGVWIVFLFALLGNGCVLFVLIMSRTKMDVPRLLICNLAVADFCMGIYLGFLAVVDASTLGEFKRHAIQWQTSPGCLVAGFLGVLSSELSVFTLTVITLERFYAITHAMHLNKRLSLRHAGYIMMCGWCFALLIASMPLFGISDYRKFAICLPFEIGDSLSLGYVCFIMFCNMIAFTIIVSCYMKMYCSVRGSQAWNSNDSRVAKRMALLVFTDFACWAPISFFSITSAFGLNLISLNDAKIFTIFILPLNSCANPFLYAIFTKQFKKDCVVICRRIEESTVATYFTRLNQRNTAGNSWGGSSHRHSGINSYLEIQRHSCNYSNSHSGLVHSNSDENHVAQPCVVVHNDLHGSQSREESSESCKSGGSFPRKLRLTLRGPKHRKVKTKRLKKQNNKERRNSYAAPVPNHHDSSLDDSNASASSLLLSILQHQLVQSEPSYTDSEGDGDSRHRRTRDASGFPLIKEEKKKRSPRSSPGCWSRRFHSSPPSGSKKTHSSSSLKSRKSSKCRSSCLTRTMSGTSNELSSPMPSSSQTSSDNNNHEYVNITEEMISRLRDVSNSRPRLHDSFEQSGGTFVLPIGDSASPVERKSEEELEACNYVVFSPRIQQQDSKHTVEEKDYVRLTSPVFDSQYIHLSSLNSDGKAVPCSTDTQAPPSESLSPKDGAVQPQNFYMDGVTCEVDTLCLKLQPIIPTNSSPILAVKQKDVFRSSRQDLNLSSQSMALNSPECTAGNDLSQHDSACDTYYESLRDTSSSTTSGNSSHLHTSSLDSCGDFAHSINTDSKPSDSYTDRHQVELNSIHSVSSVAPLLGNEAAMGKTRYPFSKSCESGFSSDETAV